MDDLERYGDSITDGGADIRQAAESEPQHGDTATCACGSLITFKVYKPDVAKWHGRRGGWHDEIGTRTVHAGHISKAHTHEPRETGS